MNHKHDGHPSLNSVFSLRSNPTSKHHAPSMDHSFKVRSTSSLALPLTSESAVSSSQSHRFPACATTGCGPRKLISTGGRPPWRYSSQKTWLGASRCVPQSVQTGGSASSHGPGRVQTGAVEIGGGRGRLTSGASRCWRRRLLRQLREDMWPPRDCTEGHQLPQKWHLWPTRGCSGGGSRHGFGAPPLEAIDLLREGLGFQQARRRCR